MMFSQKTIILISIMLSLVACASTKSSDNDEEKKIATAKINTQLGIAYLERHQIQTAKRKLLLALDEAPNIPETWYAMGYFLETTGDKDQAKTYYLKSVSLASGRGDVQNNYGTFLCRTGNYRDAIKHFELAAKDINYVDTAAAYENAGLCALKIPDNTLALLYFDKSKAQDPERPTVYLELSKLNYKMSHFKQSRMNLEEFLHLSPQTPESIQLSDRLDAKLGSRYLSGDS